MFSQCMNYYLKNATGISIELTTLKYVSMIIYPLMVPNFIRFRFKRDVKQHSHFKGPKIKCKRGGDLSKGISTQ